jgi:hypothetical protein
MPNPHMTPSAQPPHPAIALTPAQKFKALMRAAVDKKNYVFNARLGLTVDVTHPASYFATVGVKVADAEGDLLSVDAVAAALLAVPNLDATQEAVIVAKEVIAATAAQIAAAKTVPAAKPAPAATPTQPTPKPGSAGALAAAQVAAAAAKK